MGEEKAHLAVLREYYWSLPSWKVAKKNALLLRVNIVVWGFHKGLQGPRWPIHGPLPHVRWVQRRKGAFSSFKRVLLVHTLLGSGYGKWALFGGKYCCLGARMGVPRVPDGRYMAPCHRRGGLREEKVHLAVWREYYWSLPSWKAAKENKLILGVNNVVWGLGWGSPGSQMADTWPQATSEVS